MFPDHFNGYKLATRTTRSGPDNNRQNFQTQQSQELRVVQNRQDSGDEKKQHFGKKPSCPQSYCTRAKLFAHEQCQNDEQAGDPAGDRQTGRTHDSFTGQPKPENESYLKQAARSTKMP